MKRGLSYIICANIVIVIFVGGFVNLNTVVAYTDLNVGDQLLYTVDVYDQHKTEHKKWFEFNPPPEYYENSYWYIHNWDFYAQDVHSYVINQDFGSFAYVNHTYTLYDLMDYYYDESYYWDISSWIPNGPPTSQNITLDYKYSNLNPDEYFDIYSGVVNLDITDNFGSTWYNTSTTLPFTINGITQPIFVDIYSYEYTDSYMNFYGYYDVTYWETVNWGQLLTYYVDNATGYILQYDYTYYDYRDADYSNTSVELGTYLEVEYHYKDLYTSVWKLEETSVGYTPVLDADLPSMVIKSYDNTVDNTTSMISIPFYINNVYSTVTIDVYIAGAYFDTFASNNAGLKFYDIPVSAIPFDGPYWSYQLRFDVFDDYNPNHNTTWTTWVDDYRTTIPSWGPSWIEGPIDATVYEGDSWFYYNVYSDTNWTVAIYKHDGFGYIFYDWWVGFQNDSIGFWDFLSMGTYDYWIHFYDNVGVFQDIYLTVEVLDDILLEYPQINGHAPGEIDYHIGDSKTMFWTLNDDNPNYFEFLLDGAILDSGSWTDGKTFGLNLKDWIFTPGDYNITIIASDMTGYVSFYELIIHATDGTSVDTVPPSINGPTSTIYMEVGEDKEIKWVLFDDNPFEYEVFKNGALYDNDTWITPNIDVIVDLDTLGLGTWTFEIKAYDTLGYNNTATVTVVVEEASGNNNDGQTIQLDAPNILYVALGFLSVTALIAVYRKKK